MGALLQSFATGIAKGILFMRRIALLSVVLAVLGACAQAKQPAPPPQPK